MPIRKVGPWRRKRAVAVVTVGDLRILASALWVSSCASDPEGMPSSTRPDAGGASIEAGQPESGTDVVLDAARGDSLAPPFGDASVDSEWNDGAILADGSGSDVRAIDAR